MNLRGPKGRVARALGIALSPKTARILERRPNRPGQHGANPPRQRSVSNYKRQLLEKQRLRAQYNVSERQLANAFERAVRAGGNAGEALVQLLETRLDAVTYRAGLAPTIFAARQLVSHGHVRVNGRRCTIASRQVRKDDEVSLTAKGAAIPAVLGSLDRARPPAYLELDASRASARLREVPAGSQVPVLCQLSLVVEFYSR
jgi:small subunit ribosomal protein S4